MAGDQDDLDQGFGRIPLPGSVKELVTRRFEGLDDRMNRLLDMAAILGREISLDVLEGATGLDETELMVAVQDLVRRQVFDDESGVVRFAHDKIREVLAARPGPALPELHRRAAELLTELRPDAHADLGRHWERAGAFDEAREQYWTAATAARRTYAIEEAGRLYDAFLALSSGPSPEDIKVRIERAVYVLEPSGKFEEVDAEYRTALEQARSLPAPELEASSLRMVALSHEHFGRVDEAKECFRRGPPARSQAGRAAYRGVAPCTISLHCTAGRGAWIRPASARRERWSSSRSLVTSLAGCERG